LHFNFLPRRGTGCRRSIPLKVLLEVPCMGHFTQTNLRVMSRKLAPTYWDNVQKMICLKQSVKYGGSCSANDL